MEDLFHPEQRPLHAADLKPEELSPEQIGAIADFFQRNDFGRFAAIIKADFVNQTEHTPFHLAANMLLEKTLDVFKIMGGEFSNILILFEHSQRLGREVSGWQTAGDVDENIALGIAQAFRRNRTRFIKCRND